MRVENTSGHTRHAPCTKVTQAINHKSLTFRLFLGRKSHLTFCLVSPVCWQQTNPDFRGQYLYCELVAVPSKAVSDLMKAFHDVIYCIHVSPQYLSLGNGTEFVNQVLACLAQQLNVMQVNF